jgi:serine/threonine-protein kinase
MASVEQFGKYILLEQLATGGMAEVYLAKSTGAVGVNKFVAIKRILPQHSDHQEFIEMFKEEAKIAVNLNHGNVVSIYDFGVERSQFFLVMEYVEGRNLRQILNELKRSNTQFTIEQIAYMAKEVAAGLDHAHRCIDGTTGKPLNINHRDMSPQNIMVSFEGEVKIIDFGIAKSENQLEATKAGTLKGKFSYMSPEQADGQSIDLRTDIFSLGIVIWELLANDRLFTANSEAAILRKVREAQIPSIRKINPSVPPELERIVTKALAKDRSLRYQTAAALHRDLNRFLNTQYPEFSPQDFSVFMKNAFSQAFLEQRRKLVDYAKIQNTSPAPGVDEKTVVTQTDTRRGSPARPNGPPTPDPSLEDPLEGNLDLNTSTDVRVNLDILKAPPKPTWPKLDTNITQGGHTHNGPVPMPPPVRAGTMTGTMNRTHTGVRRGSVSSGSNTLEVVTTWAMRAVITAIVGIGAWWGYTNYYKKNMLSSLKAQATRAITSQTAPTPPPPPVEVEHVEATSAQYTVTIYSNPDKARVFINGEDQERWTPFVKSFPANTPFNLQLKKEGFVALNTAVSPTYEAYTFTGTLQKHQRVASLIINIINGGANQNLKIGGVPVIIKPYGELYMIQAEVDVKIQVYNPTTKLSAEKTVHVSADKKEIVDLYLK